MWQQESYPCQQQVLVGYHKEKIMLQEQHALGTQTITWTETVQVQVGTQQEQRTRQVPVYVTETYFVDVPVYETQTVNVQQTTPVYEQQTNTWTQRELRWPVQVSETFINLGDGSNTIYIDGWITSLRGDLNGRLTIVGNEKVRVTGSIRYVDDDGDTAMLNGDKFNQPYVRNENYDGKSVLGVVARDDVLLTSSLPTQSEINATLLSATGRVGIDGFQISDLGEPVKNWSYGLTAATTVSASAGIYRQNPAPIWLVSSTLNRYFGELSFPSYLAQYQLSQWCSQCHTRYDASRCSHGRLRPR